MNRDRFEEMCSNDPLTSAELFVDCLAVLRKTERLIVKQQQDGTTFEECAGWLDDVRTVINILNEKLEN